MQELPLEIALSCRSLSKKFQKGGNDFWALNDLSFELKKGEILGVIGRNGAGKSSLLKLLSRIIIPTAGEILYRGRLASIIEIGTGFHGDLSGRENVYMNASLLGYKKAEIDVFYKDIVEFSGLEGYMDTAVKNYSSGMYLRLAFSIAFQSDIDILLLDEIIAVGDADFRNKCYNKIRELSQNGVSIIIVSHNTNQLTDFCDRCLLIDQGELIAEGDPLEVINHYLELSSIQEGINVGAKLDLASANSDKSIHYESKLEELALDSVRFEGVEVYVNGERNVQNVYTEDELTIKLDFEQLGEETLEFAWYLTNMDGQKVLIDSPSMRKNLGFEQLEQGRYTSKCVIPGNLLTRGVYKLGIIMCKWNWEAVAEVPNVIRIKINAEDSIKAGRQISSIVHPHLDWQLVKK